MAEKVKIKHRFSGVRAAIGTKKLDKAQIKKLMAAIKKNPKADEVTQKVAAEIRKDPIKYFNKVTGTKPSDPDKDKDKK